MKKTVVVIGGGATGTGVLRDLALRGIDAVLVEQGLLNHGTSGRYHGLLHSGARYAVKDVHSAAECASENALLRRLAGDCILDCGGYFIYLEGDDPSYIEPWLKGCREAGIGTEEVPLAEAKKLEPSLSRQVRRVFAVPDASVDGFLLTRANVDAALGAHPGCEILTECKVTGIRTNNGKVTGVQVNSRTRGIFDIACEMIISATGPWGGDVAKLAGIDLGLHLDKGSLLVFNHRFVNRVVNRLRPPGDGDILVPDVTTSIFGTTSLSTDLPGNNEVTKEELEKLMRLGGEMFHQIGSYRVIRGFAGVRPLVKEEVATADGRSVSRGHAVLNHLGRDGLQGMITIIGGKLTTYRLMAEQTVDEACRQLGLDRPCRTREVPLDSAMGRRRRSHWFGVPEEAAPTLEDMQICECEQVGANLLLESCPQEATSRVLDELRQRTRMGMGTCQGTYCAYRAVGLLHQRGKISGEMAGTALQEFMGRRWKGTGYACFGDQAKEEEFSKAIYKSFFNLKAGEVKPGV